MMLNTSNEGFKIQTFFYSKPKSNLPQNMHVGWETDKQMYD